MGLNPNKDVVLAKTSTKVMKFEQSERNYQGSIYRREKVPDHYDADSIGNAYLSLSQYTSPKATLNMGKQGGRDYKKFYMSTSGEAVNNIKRDNARQDWIKQLLSGK